MISGELKVNFSGPAGSLSAGRKRNRQNVYFFIRQGKPDKWLVFSVGQTDFVEDVKNKKVYC